MPQFVRRLTLLDLVLVATGGAIGSGIFRTPSQVATALPSAHGVLTVWALGGILTLAGALTLAYLRLLPMAELVASPHVAADAASAGLGPVGGAVVTAAVGVSALGSAGIYTLTTPRIAWAMADRGVLFRSLAALHPRWRTPARAIALQTAWASALVLAWGTFEGLVSYVLFVDWIFFGLAGAAVFVLRRRQGRPPGYVVPGYPLVPLAFVAMSVWFVGSTLLGQPAQALAGGALLALGAGAYAVGKRA